MSKQHKLEYKGKKYVTKFGDCHGCAFPSMTPACATKIGNYKCMGYNNKDLMPRIWVEDTTDKKTTKTKCHYWIVELYSNISKDWWPYELRITRSQARKCVKDIGGEDKARIRKFVPTKPRRT